jgi:type II secretory pathway pseudopilin PulG
VRREGYTLLELMVSATLFLFVAGAVVTTLAVCTALNTTNRESALASRGAQSALEELGSTTFAEVFARYNDTAADDPVGGASPGNAFAIRGLSALADDADGFVGAIEFPVQGAELREDVVDADLGLPRDLNGDGAIDGADHSADYRILPVRVTVSWTGQNGVRSLDFVTVLTER